MISDERSVSPSPDAVLVDFQATRPDGCVSLELNGTIADLKEKNMQLRDGQALNVWATWRGKTREASGVVKWNEEWGWGVEIDGDALSALQGDDES